MGRRGARPLRSWEFSHPLLPTRGRFHPCRIVAGALSEGEGASSSRLRSRVPQPGSWLHWGQGALWGHLGAPRSSSRCLAATTRAGTSVEKKSPPVVLVPRHNRANSRDGHSYLFLPRSQWKFHNTFMTLDAPQWPECAGPEVKEAGGKKMIDSEPAKSTRWNGAEQLFSAAKAYGIRCCFANPGTSDDRTPWGVFDSTSFVHILRSFPSSSSTRSRPTA
jgi:hypothetical protein